MNETYSLREVLIESDMVVSMSQVRRYVGVGGVRINGSPVSLQNSADLVIKPSDVVTVGKHCKVMMRDGCWTKVVEQKRDLVAAD